MNILIADDHAIVRAGLRQILLEAALDGVVGEADDGVQALEMALNGDWDIVILDITMPGMTGLQVLKALKREKPALPVVMLSMHASPVYVRGALQAGAAGYITKEAAPEELLTALQTARAGNTFLGRGVEPGLDYHAE